MLTGDQEGSASVHVANVGKPPEVAQADGEAQAGQEELAVVVPLASLRPLGLGLGDLEFFFRHLFRHFRGKSVFFSSLYVRSRKRRTIVEDEVQSMMMKICLGCQIVTRQIIISTSEREMTTAITLQSLFIN